MVLSNQLHQIKKVFLIKILFLFLFSFFTFAEQQKKVFFQPAGKIFFLFTSKILFLFSFNYSLFRPEKSWKVYYFGHFFRKRCQNELFSSKSGNFPFFFFSLLLFLRILSKKKVRGLQKTFFLQIFFSISASSRPQKKKKSLFWNAL